MKYKHPRDVFLTVERELGDIRKIIAEDIDRAIDTPRRNLEIDLGDGYDRLGETARSLLHEELEASGWRLHVPMDGRTIFTLSPLFE